MSEPTKFCKDCKWAQRSWFGFVSRFARCQRVEDVTDYYLVAGRNPMSKGVYCAVERKDYNTFDSCGVSAKYWEPRK